ncbi:hypothetical protein K6U47_10625 [Vibrio furnissii]|nr:MULTISPECIES: hypothetical protein [Vibrio]MCG6268045.1 hypothetical protein [Vibrio furnissii]MDF5331672.1 hypothetical protein [Vibrio parahaemolyticus]MDS1923330.1 hypothetical protein [Vibrio parahaemolyticus]
MKAVCGRLVYTAFTP